MCPGVGKRCPCSPMSHVVPVTQQGSCRLLGVVLVTPNGSTQVDVNQWFLKKIFTWRTCFFYSITLCRSAYEVELFSSASVQVRDSPRKKSPEEAGDFAKEGKLQNTEGCGCNQLFQLSFFFHRELLSLSCGRTQVSCFSNDTGTLFSHCRCVWVMCVPTFAA